MVSGIYAALNFISIPNSRYKGYIQKNKTSQKKTQKVHINNAFQKSINFGDERTIFISGFTDSFYRYFRSGTNFTDFAQNGKLSKSNLNNYYIFDGIKKNYSAMKNCIFSFCDFSKSVLASCLFDNSDFSNSIFQHSNLSRSSFKDIVTENTNFDFVNFAGADFSGAKFGKSTSFVNTNLISAKLEKVNNIYAAEFGHSVYDLSTTFPKGFIPEVHGMFLLTKGADFSDKDIGKIKLRQVYFDSIKFKDTNLRKADLKDSYFVNCDMQNVILSKAYAKQSIWTDCDLSGGLLKHLNLEDAELKNVNMENAVLNGANLKWKTAENINLKNATYDIYTSFNYNIKPEDYGMIYDTRPQYKGKYV